MNSITAVERDVALVGQGRRVRHADQARARRATRRAAADALALVAALLVAAPADLPGLTLGLAAACLIGFLAQGQYELHVVPSLGRQLRSAVGVVSSAALMEALVAVAVVGRDSAAGPVARFYAVATVAVATGRAGIAALDHRRRLAGADQRRTLIIGAGDVGRMAARRLAARPELGLAPIGFLDRDPREGPADLPVLGSSWDLERVVDEHDVDAVVIGFSTAPHRVLLSIVRRCWDLGLEVLVVPRLFEAEGTRTVVERIGGLPIVGIARGPVAGPRLRAKYLVERLMTAALLVLLAPVMALVALAVLVTSGRPILYRAPRVGTGGRPFQMLKFRTMPGTPESRGEADAEWATEILREHGLDVDADADAIAPAPQLTPIGHVLRRTSLDELPQLINVVRGEMALVGPRPERVQYAERFAPAVYRYAERHRVRPGITGWAQVHGLRGSTSLDDRVEWDLFYVENWTPWLDVRILARTVSAVWRGARKE